MTPIAAYDKIISDPYDRPLGDIQMADGRVYHVVGKCERLVERYSPDGDLLERIDVADIEGDAEPSWSCDQLGGVYI